mmetsp:Transcript_9387/g.17010  ORF Transcript_9387/g.17010 Transcript_9387/m.17010 type:complete len:129 (+) Transcript_9387:1746-2132(+)
MVWSGSSDWNSVASSRGLWTVEGQPAGYAKAVKGLEFVVVYNSGHLVPMNQPVHALDLIERFVRNQRFSDEELPTFADIPDNPGMIKRQKHANPFWFGFVVGSLILFLSGTMTLYFCRDPSHYDRILE